MQPGWVKPGRAGLRHRAWISASTLAEFLAGKMPLTVPACPLWGSLSKLLPGGRWWTLESDPSGAQGDESASPAWNPCAVTASYCWSKFPKIAIRKELATIQSRRQYPTWFGLLCQFPLWVLESIRCPCYCCVCLPLPTSRSTGHFGTGPALPRAACSIALSLSFALNIRIQQHHANFMQSSICKSDIFTQASPSWAKLKINTL